MCVVRMLDLYVKHDCENDFSHIFFPSCAACLRSCANSVFTTDGWPSPAFTGEGEQTTRNAQAHSGMQSYDAYVYSLSDSCLVKRSKPRGRH